MKQTTVFDCSIIKLPKISTDTGTITSINSLAEVPFDVKRVYYLYDVPGGESRGGHAHKELKQLIVAASGSFDIVIDDGVTKRKFTLSRPYYGLLMPQGIWRNLINFSSGAICLVLASSKYSESDYIRSYDDFTRFKLG